MPFKSLVLVLILSLFTHPNIHSDARIFLNNKNETIRHVVCFKFKESAKKSEIERVEKEFSALKDKIPGILSLEWGKNNSPENLNKDFTHCFIVLSKMRRPEKYISLTLNIWPLYQY